MSMGMVADGGRHLHLSAAVLVLAAFFFKPIHNLQSISGDIATRLVRLA